MVEVERRTGEGLVAVKTYRANVTRGERFWLVEVEGVGWTQARHLREVEEMARDLVAVMTEVEPESFALEVTTSLPGAVQAHLDRAEALRQESARTQHEAAAEVRAAARELAATGLPLRDVAVLLGVSHQRAHQLVSSST
jgi:hypothetical protein